MITKDKRLLGIVLTIALILSIPLIAMQFTEQVNWSSSDFLIAGVLLLGTGLTCEFVLRNVRKTSYRLIACGILFVALALVWIELAVGIFGTPFAGS